MEGRSPEMDGPDGCIPATRHCLLQVDTRNNNRVTRWIRVTRDNDYK